MNDVDDLQEEGTIPRPRNTMTGLVNGPDDRPDTAKHLSPDEGADFVAADAAEWKVTVDSGSVKVLNPDAADTVRRERPDRVINSRMVSETTQAAGGHLPETRGQVPMVRLGHQDPDAADTFTYVPTPQTASIMLFFFLLQVCGLTLSIAYRSKKGC